VANLLAGTDGVSFYRISTALRRSFLNTVIFQGFLWESERVAMDALRFIFYRHSMIVAARNFHKKVVWMLTVNDGLSKGSFARVEQQWVTALSHCRWLQTEHPAKHQRLPKSRENIGINQFVEKSLSPPHGPLCCVSTRNAFP
jgi:hypothetical protein